ncbi:MAG: hypothetical protein GX558_10400 [Clostridiales bacterium]|nr:hypothetical protein [Clostridiales bacterium]
MDQDVIFYFSGTHWDREWYRTFQGFRLKLVEMLDALIEALETDGRLRAFHLDGQTILVDDYLEARPEMRDRLGALIRAGRVIIGPWYCMPDEHLVSGEALIRNLELGAARCRDWGVSPWPVGYVCDVFGHIAQLPQILNGFGIGTAVLGRGTNEHTTPAVFCWAAPDGSRVTALKLPDKSGYGSFAMDVCGQAALGAMRAADDPAFLTAAREYVDHEKARTDTGIAIVWDGMDHEGVHPQIPEYLAALAALYPGDRVEYGNLTEVFDEIRRRGPALPMRHGELMEPTRGEGPHLHLLVNTLSSRQSLKARNDYCQDLLEKHLEPLCVHFRRQGLGDYRPFLRLAWESLLQNHPHDSICGCSVDRVHEEMKFRFSQVESIAEAVEARALDELAGGRASIGDGADTLVVVNPLPTPYRDLVRLRLPFAPGYPKWSEPFHYQHVCAFRLVDDAGREAPYAIESIDAGANVLVAGEQVKKADLYTLLVPLKFKGQGGMRLRVVPSGRPVRDLGAPIASADGALENAFLRVEIAPDATVTLTDKRTGRAYGGLMRLLDDGEIGDGWNHVPPRCDRIYLGARLISVCVTVDGSVAGALRAELSLMIPEGNERLTSGEARSGRLTALCATLRLTLGRDDRAVRVSLTVDNCARDHRLRLAFPTGIAGGEYEVNDTFCFLRRPVGLDASTHDWKERDRVERPTGGIVLKRDAQGRGLAVIDRGGLHECAALDDARGTLCLTLLRAFGRTHTTNGEDGGQELFAHDYQMLLQPLDGEDNTALQQLQIQLKARPASFVSRAWRPEQGRLALSGAVCFSALRPIDGGAELRLYNPGEREAGYRLEGLGDWTRVRLCALDGRALARLAVVGGRLEGMAPAHGIVTLRLTKSEEE